MFIVRTVDSSPSSAAVCVPRDSPDRRVNVWSHHLVRIDLPILIGKCASTITSSNISTSSTYSRFYNQTYSLFIFLEPTQHTKTLLRLRNKMNLFGNWFPFYSFPTPYQFFFFWGGGVYYVQSINYTQHDDSTKLKQLCMYNHIIWAYIYKTVYSYSRFSTKTCHSLFFMPPRSMIGGHIVFVLSVILSSSLKLLPC